MRDHSASATSRARHGRSARPQHGAHDENEQQAYATMVVKAMALPSGQLKPKENWLSMKVPISAAPPPTKRGVT